MSKSRNKIPPEIKSQILSELQKPGCMIPKLAKAYNVSSTTIRAWQKQAQEIRVETGGKVDGSSNFVELSVKDTRNSTLERAS